MKLNNWRNKAVEFWKVFYFYPPLLLKESYAFGEWQLDIIELEKLLKVSPEQSMRDFVLEKYGQKGVDLIEEWL
ncbi:hypothetical protein [Candidatus Avelusimicrobium fimicolum]|uniref:hypothetical protein n=1 Tax=Candidatus Avelusimicrobium fimicolum TaxID=3416216 RepID=UPI003D10AD54